MKATGYTNTMPINQSSHQVTSSKQVKKGMETGRFRVMPKGSLAHPGPAWES